jgi:disulfide bond formation protein DsbB
LFGVLSALFCLGGMGIAGRQIWLQHLPEDAKPSCGPGLDYWIQNFPLWDVVKNVLIGTGDCARVDWTFLTLSIAQWSFLWFGFLLILSIAIVIKRQAD